MKKIICVTLGIILLIVFTSCKSSKDCGCPHPISDIAVDNSQDIKV